MADFKSIFDNSRQRAEEEKERERQRQADERQLEQDAFKAKMHPIMSILLPVLVEATSQLETKQITIKKDFMHDLLWRGSEKITSTHFQMQYKATKPSKTYVFTIFPNGQISCSAKPYDNGPHHTSEQLFRCGIDEFSRERVEDVVGRAVAEVASRVQ